MKGLYPRARFWCPRCDACVVELVVKCRECGHRERKRKRWDALSQAALRDQID